MKLFTTALVGIFAATLAIAPIAAAERYETLPYALSPSSAPAESGVADINGAKIHYEVYGKKGDPILLIHGGAGNTEIWGNEINAWLKTNRVIVADTRGHGASTAGDLPFSYHQFAEDYVALLDFLKVDKTALVGWSDGGIIGIDIALNHPERLTKLVALAANVTTDGVLPTVGDDVIFNKYLDRARGEFERLSPTKASFDDYLEQINTLWATEPAYTDEQLATITTPTLILIGDHDQAISQEHTAHIAQAIPGSKLVVLENVSHFAFLQDPDGFNKVVYDFLSE